MKKLVLLVAALAVLGVGAIGAFYAFELLGSDDADLATTAPAIPTTTSSGTTTSGATQAAISADVLRFTIDPAQSSAKYVVKETLRGVPDVQAVGTTSAITGDLYLTRQGLATSPKSVFKVDLTQLRTDQSMRDNFVRQNALQTNRFPTAEFTIDSIAQFPAGYVEGSEVNLTLTGSLNLHGVTKPVTWTVKARQAGAVLTATADVDIKMTDFNITPPDVGFAKAQDDVHIQVILVSNRVTG